MKRLALLTLLTLGMNIGSWAQLPLRPFWVEPIEMPSFLIRMPFCPRQAACLDRQMASIEADERIAGYVMPPFTGYREWRELSYSPTEHTVIFAKGTPADEMPLEMRLSSDEAFEHYYMQIKNKKSAKQTSTDDDLLGTLFDILWDVIFN